MRIKSGVDPGVIPQGSRVKSQDSQRENDGARALDFYRQAFGAQEIFRVPGPDGRIAHAQMRIGDSLVFLADEDPNNLSGYRSPKTLGGTSFAIYMYVADADAIFDQSLGAGAESLFRVAEQPWGDREGLVRDPFGHLWAVAMRKSS